MGARNRGQPAVLHAKEHVDAGQLAEHAHVAFGELRRLERQKRRAAHLLGCDLGLAPQRGQRHGQFLRSQLQKRLAIAYIGMRIEQKCVGHRFSPSVALFSFRRFLSATRISA